MNDVFSDFDDWHKYQDNQQVKSLWSPGRHKRESGLFRMTQNLEMMKLSPDQQDRLRRMSGNQSSRIRRSMKNVEESYYSGQGSKKGSLRMPVEALQQVDELVMESAPDDGV